MIFNIQHITTYSYSRPVALGPQIIQLHPRNNNNQKVHKFDIQIDPIQEGKSFSVDIEGNNTITVWFKGKTEYLRILTSSTVETLNENPFEYVILDNNFLNLPIKYSDIYGKQLKPYINIKQNKSVRDLSGITLKDSNCHTINFISKLNDFIYKNFTQIKREEGRPWSSDETLKKGKGSCRDLTTLFVDLCRSVGLACRYISGYTYSGSDSENELHAWAEVYMPGAGWRGYDPTTGLAVSNRHVAVASGSTYELIAPLIGHFFSKKVSSKLNYDIKISAE